MVSVGQDFGPGRAVEEAMVRPEHGAGHIPNSTSMGVPISLPWRAGVGFLAAQEVLGQLDTLHGV